MAEEHDETPKSLTARLMAGVGERIREERERRGWTQQQLAEKAGTTQQTINRIERGVTAHSRAIPAAEAVLGIRREGSPDESAQERAQALLYEARYRPTAPDVEARIAASKIPVYSSVLLDGVICRAKEPFRWMYTPEPLRGVQGGFALVVYEEAMIPAYYPGDIILIHPMLKPRQRDDALLISRSFSAQQIRIGQFVSAGDHTWIIRQHDSQAPQAFDQSEWDAYTIVGRFIRV